MLMINNKLKKNINLQVLDNDKRTILFNIVKFNYIDMLKILIEYNNKSQYCLKNTISF